MKITYDPEVDAMYIRLVEGRHECTNMHINEDVTLDLGLNDVVVGIEILGVRELMGQGRIPAVQLVNLPNVAVNSDGVPQSTLDD